MTPTTTVVYICKHGKEEKTRESCNSVPTLTKDLSGDFTDELKVMLVGSVILTLNAPSFYEY